MFVYLNIFCINIEMQHVKNMTMLHEYENIFHKTVYFPS